MIICDYCGKEISGEKPISFETCLIEDGSGIDGGYEWNHFHLKCVQKLDKKVCEFVEKELKKEVRNSSQP